MATETEQLGLLRAWEDAQAQAAQDERRAQRIAGHHRAWTACWPEWDGPEVGGLCEVSQCVATKEDGAMTYAYMQQCRLLNLREDGTWLAVIEMDDIDGKPWSKNGVRLILEDTDIWPPTRQIWALRRAAVSQ